MTDTVPEEGARGIVAAAPAFPDIQPEPWLANYAAIARAVAADYVTVPDAIKARPASVLAVMLTGRELHLGPMESLRLLSVIKGRITVAAELKARWIREAGGKIDVVYNDQNRLRIRGTRPDGESLEVEWALSARSELEGTESYPAEDATIVENIAQGFDQKGNVRYLISGDQWQNYPQDMLWARAVSQLHRRLFPDSRGAWVYSTEEMGDGNSTEAA